MKLGSKHFLWPLLIAGLVALSFLPVLHGEFLSWDDQALFVENPHFRGLSPEHWQWMCTTFFFGHWQPLSWLSCALDYKVWGMNPLGWHATNLLLHTVNAVLVYLLCLAFMKKPDRRYGVAALAALFWAVHPLRVEPVAWLATRGYLLCTTFCLLTVLFYLRSVGQKRYPLMALLFFTLATFTKGIGMMLPLVLLLMDWHRARGMGHGGGGIPNNRQRITNNWKLLAEKFPFFALSLVTGGTAFLAKRADGGMAPMEVYGPIQRVGQAIYGVWFYLCKTVSPQNLSPLYEKHPELWQVLTALIFSTTVVIFVFLFRRRLFPILGTFGVFLLLIFPMLGIIQSGVQLYAERFTYLAAVSFSILLAAGLSRVRVLRRTVYGAVSALLCIFALQAGTYAFVWGNEGRLWNHAVMEDDASAVGHNELGLVLLDQAKYEAALVHFQRATQLDPRSAMFMHNTALALAGLKRYNAALEKWDEAAGMSGVSVRDAGRIMLARGWVYEQMGDPFRTEQMYSDLIELAGADPELCARALQLRAVLRIKAGCIGSALPDLQRILELPVALEKKEKAASALNALKKIPEAEAPGIF